MTGMLTVPRSFNYWEAMFTSADNKVGRTITESLGCWLQQIYRSINRFFADDR